LGVTTFDHADVYGGGQAEVAFGQVFDPKLRSRIQLISKCGIRPPQQSQPDIRIKHYDTSARHIVASVERSLGALNTDHLDVLLLHRPDPLLSANEVADAFHKLSTAGKVRHFGVSNFTPCQLELVSTAVGRPLVTNQIEFNLGHMNPLYDGTLDQAQRLGLFPMAWSPLAGGALSTSNEGRWQRIQGALDSLAQRHSATREQIAVAWLLRHPSGVLPVLGTGNIDRMAILTKAEQINLERQDWFELLEASAGQAVP